MLFAFISTSFAQTIQQITWENNGTNYSALLFFKNSNDILVHINYSYNGVQKIAKYKAQKLTYPTHSQKDIVIEPTTDIKTIYASNKDLSRVLLPLNFVLVNFNKETNKGDKWIALKDSDMKNISLRTKTAAAGNKFYNSIDELSAKKIDLKNYFPATDPDYKSLIANTFFPKNQVTKPLVEASKKTTVHLFLVGDTLDPQIGKDVIHDIKEFQTKIKNSLAYCPEISLKATLIAGKDLTGNNVVNNLKKLTINPQDAIIFYYGGHGYNHDKENKKSDFPTMKMLKNDLSLEAIHNYFVQTKKPRFSLVMGDLCNTIEPKRPKKNKEPLLMAQRRPPIEKENIERLFKYAKGHILSTSSTYDQYSVSINGSGAFSQTFFTVFDQAIIGMYGPTDWKIILENSYKKTFELTKVFENKNNKMGQQGFMKGTVTYVMN